ncbi:MerR family transcriptional regulator [Anaerocolumna cellulosilytica]|uniref:MerR family transcriptional regulator n=1 Tax=Anaerocolumna cellulosilytica TaxID=433286 RepID=A0A6S6R3A2_9FIRM|nr:effector binding domain-containing protein [Anaerocolumna cellulosilytica]MBB5196777.1 DNA-binding transcriptional MerR regulator [Anaerocolumna cellulosilytica]BCJ95829.1 MerR family transcriptional regulator [Anaerocolumna cellulosilytica]
MFKIGEFSKLTQVSIRMLRYYDETGLLKPAETDKFTSYRLYTSEQIPVLNKIIFLRDLGFNVSEISNMLMRWSDELIVKQLEHKYLEIESVIKAEQERLSKIELAKKDIKQKKIDIHYNVSIKAIPSYQVLSLRRIVPDYYAEGQLWIEMSDFAKKNNIPISTETFTIYHDLDYKERDVDIEICSPVSQMSRSIGDFTYHYTEAVSNMACTMVYGSFNNIALAYRAFAKWLQEHNQYKMEGQSRQIVHRGPWNEEYADNYLIEIQIPLKKV